MTGVAPVAPDRDLMLSAALEYAKAGMAVFPVAGVLPDGTCRCGKADCNSIGKHPHSMAHHGSKAATTNLETVRRWWRKDPHANIGIVPAKCNPALAVLDIDPRNGGNETRSELEKQHGPFTRLIECRSGGGGVHLWFRAPPNAQLPGKAGAGIDVIYNLYVVVPPSLHKSGQRYEWLPDRSLLNDGDREFLPPLPAWIAESRDSSTSAPGTAVDPPGEIDLQAREDAMRYDDTPANRAKLLSALKSLDPDADHSRYEYRRVLCALNSTGWADWLELAERWASGEMHGITAEKFDEEVFNSDVKDLSNDKPKNLVTVGSIFKFAKAAGWIDPRSVNRDEGVHPLAQFISLDAEPKAPRMVIPGLIAHGLVIIAGVHSVGKTTTLVPLAMTPAGLHGPDDPLAPKRWRHVVYVTEDPEQVLRILAGIVEFGGLGIDSATVRERLHIVEARRLDPAYVAEVATTYREQFARTVDGVELLPLVVFDTKSSVFAIDEENSNSEASAIVAMLKQSFQGLPVWLVGHIPKASVSRTDVAGLSLRGASAFEGDANQTMFLIKEGEQRYLVLGKTRFEPRWSEVLIQSRTATTIASDEFGDMYPLVLRWGIASPPEQSRKAAQEQAQEAQREAETTALRVRCLTLSRWLGRPDFR